MFGIFSGVFGSIAMSLLRQALMAGGAVLVAKGWVDGSQLQELIGAIVAIVSSFLSGANAVDAAKHKAVVADLQKAAIAAAPAAEVKKAVEKSVTPEVKKNWTSK